MKMSEKLRDDVLEALNSERVNRKLSEARNKFVECLSDEQWRIYQHYMNMKHFKEFGKYLFDEEGD